MESSARSRSATADATPTAAFARFTGYAAILAGLGGLLYSLDFVAVARNLRTSAPELGAFLLLGGLLTSAVFVALYQRVRTTDSGFAALALLLGVVGALGSGLHGAYDLANTFYPVTAVTEAAKANIPSQVDPRGLATFGLTGLAVFLFAALMVRSTDFPRVLGYLGLLLVVIYLGRLIVVNPTPLLAPAGLTGVLINPIWYCWLGIVLLRSRAPTP